MDEINLGIFNKILKIYGISMSIELTRIRFEHYYNGNLCFDIYECNFDCLFCFSKKTRYLIKENKSNSNDSIVIIPFNELLFKKNGKGISFKEKYEKTFGEFIDKEFGKNDSHNNVIYREKKGKCLIRTTTSEIIGKIKEILKNTPFKIHSIRFSGGEVLFSKNLEWYVKFLKEYFKDSISDNNLKLIIETNGSCFNEKSNNELFQEFLNLIFQNKGKIHVRISLKSPIPTFYEILTKRGTKRDLDNAIKFGIYCYEKKIPFHFTIMANYLDIEALKILQHKILDSSSNSSKLKLNDFFIILRNIEYERLFLYEGVFKEWLISRLILNKQIENGKEISEKFLVSGKWKEKCESLKEYFSKDTNKGEKKAYYERFSLRTIPKFFKKEKMFINDLKQQKFLYEIYSDKKNTDFLTNVEKTRRNSIIFKGFQGIQEFWQKALQTRYLLYDPGIGAKDFINDKKITFQNVSLIDRIPLYPGIFYLYDFWKHGNPNFFIYTLYAERKYLEISNCLNATYVFSINNNPITHAHTDVSRAIPFRIQCNSNKLKELVEKIIGENVIEIERMTLLLKKISFYKVRYKGLKILIPFFVLELESFSDIKIKDDKEKTPFLANIGALYENLILNENIYYYLNYFFWTGVESQEESREKALKYLTKFEKLGDNNLKENFFYIKCLEPKKEIWDNLHNIKQNGNNFFGLIRKNDYSKILSFFEQDALIRLIK